MHPVDGEGGRRQQDDFARFVRSAQHHPVLLDPPKGLHPAGTLCKADLEWVGAVQRLEGGGQVDPKWKGIFIPLAVFPGHGLPARFVDSPSKDHDSIFAENLEGKHKAATWRWIGERRSW